MEFRSWRSHSSTLFFLFRFTCNFIAGTSCDRCYVRLTFPHDYWCLQSKKWSLFSQKRREGNETIFVPTETQSSKPTFLSFFSFFHGIDGPIILLWGYISSGCPIADEPIFEKKRGAGHVGRNELPEHYWWRPYLTFNDENSLPSLISFWHLQSLH